MGEVFVLHPVLNKNLSLDFENSSPFSRNPSSEDDWSNWQKNGFHFLGGRFWRVRVVYSDPPEVVSGIGRGGLSSP
jgi:hypothetical protein